MNHTDHVNLLRRGIHRTGGVWADFGSGTGAFTLALAELIRPGGEIHSVDTDAGALRRQADAMQQRFPRIALRTYPHDYTRPLALPPLDGLVAANTLHFHRDQAAIVRLLKRYLKEGGRVLIVEYNITTGNLAVPHPLPLAAWQALAERCGFVHTELLATRPSRFLTEIYSAASW